MLKLQHQNLFVEVKLLKLQASEPGDDKQVMIPQIGQNHQERTSPGY
ncbi:MAG: hypothetical protein GDA56_10645 [Hormoscilla sp. GM7CHS1pb]|nr:hypothetical protein [Hormoscilla sp. GM7CHS1pb]